MILAADVGITACRAAIFERAKARSFAYKEYQNITHAPDLVEQDPRVWVSHLLESMEECVRKSKEDSDSIEVTVVASQRATIIPVDRNGKSLSNDILWLDERPSLNMITFIPEYALAIPYHSVNLQ